MSTDDERAFAESLFAKRASADEESPPPPPDEEDPSSTEARQYVRKLFTHND